MIYSAKQEQSGTDVGVSAEMPQQAMPATPDREGQPGPEPTTAWPWAGRGVAAQVAFDGSAQAFSTLARQAQTVPGSWVTSSETAGEPNTGPRE